MDIGSMIPNMIPSTGMITIAMYFLFGLILMIPIGYFIYLQTYKKITVLIIDTVSDSGIAEIDNAREIKSDDGVTYWHFLRRGAKTPAPTGDCVFITKKGKKLAIALRLTNGQYHYLQSRIAKDKILEPLTTNQRLLYIRELRKAEAKRKQSWKENLPIIVSVSALAIIIVVGFIFGDKILEKFGSIVNTLDGLLQKADNILGKIERMEKGSQNIGSTMIAGAG